MLTLQISLQAATIDQSFTYDALNRLTTSSGGTYIYDAAGNLLTITGPPPTKPGGPTPGSGTSGTGRLPTLGWTAAQNATGLTLYYSTNSNLSGATQLSLTGNATSYAFVSPLAYNTTIWWRIDAFNGAGQNTTGDLWSFTTQVNTAPTLAAITDRSTNEDTTLSGISLSIGDGETAAGLLTVEATSGSTAIVPDANLTISSSGTSRSLSIQPAANASGPCVITVKVTDDGGLFTTRQFTLTVNPVNDLPAITDIASQTIDEDQPGGTGAISFTIGDVETLPGNLVVTATSGTPAVVPSQTANLVLNGNGATRTLTVLPAANAFGTSTITVKVTDADLGEQTDTFLLTVNAVNDAPTITAISEQAILPNASTGALPFIILDVETAAASLVLGKGSSNQTLVPLNNITLGGSGSSRTVSVTPASGQTGLATITVSVSDGAITTPTTFLLRVSNNNANLASLTLSSGTLSPAFVQGTVTYTTTVPNAAATITATPTLADVNATVRVNGNLVTSGTPCGSIPLSVGSNAAITVLVTAQDGTTKTYSVAPTRNPLPAATTLASTSIGSSTATLNGTVNPQGVSTTVTFQYGTTTSYGSTATVIGSPFTGSSATSVSAGLTGLLPGTLYHYQVLAANATDSTPGSDMTFTTVSDNARLASLTISAASIAFQPDTLSYSTTVPNSTSSLTVTPAAQQANATLKINTVTAPSGSGTAVPLNVGDNAISLVVTAQDGTTTRAYTLNVRRRSTDATLASLNLSGITLSPAFATGTASYTATVPFVTASTTITATTAHASAVVTSGVGLRNLSVGPNALGVLVTAEDGNPLTYNVTVTRDPASTNASLASLTLSTGTLSPAFDPGTLGYSATVAANVTSVTVTSALQQANATLTIQGTSATPEAGRGVNLVTGDNAVPIVVTAQDGTTTKTYTLTIRRRSTVADLASLSLSGVALSPAFSSATTAYTATVPNATAGTTITAATTHASATLAGDGLRTLNTGSNPLVVTVTAEDGNTKDYTVTVLRNPLVVAVTGSATAVTATSATLNGSINAGGVSTSTGFEYGTTTGYGQTLSGIPGSISGTGATSVTAAITSLAPGTLYHFRARGANSTDRDEGADMSFTTLRNNASLASLTVNAGTLAFNNTTTAYHLTVVNAVTSITVTPTVMDSAATVKVNNVIVTSGGTSDSITLVEGINPAIQVLVTAEDGTTKDYTLTYTRARLPSVASLFAYDVTKSSARLEATVNANGEAATVSIEHSQDPDFATFTSVPATPATVTGTAATPIALQLTGLTKNTAYHWRIRAVSAAGERVVTASSFTTLDSDAYLMSLIPEPFGSATPVLTPAFSPAQTGYASDVLASVPEFTCRLRVPSLSAHVYIGTSLLSSSGSHLTMTAYQYLQTGANTLPVTVKDVDLNISRTYTITINRAGGTPTFDYNSEPYSAVLIAGTVHFFNPPVAGKGPIFFQWRKNGSIIPGATSRRYDFPGISALHAGRYSLTAQNTLGARTSREGLLAVITSQPASRVTLAANSALSLSVAGVAPKGTKLTYQWYRSTSDLANGGRISGATSPTLRITGMTSADEAVYFCIISMIEGTAPVATGSTDGTEVLMAELPEISASPLPGAAVSVMYSERFPTDGAARKTPSSYAATGLPPGLKCDPKSGEISGLPSAARKDRFGAVIPYDVTLTAKNAKGTAIRKVTLRVEPLPEFAVGVFAAPLPRDDVLNEGLGGRFDMTVLSTGTFSGKATVGTLSWPFSGVLVGGDEPAASFSIKRKTGQAALTASFRLIPGSRMLQNGILADGAAQLGFIGWRQALPVHATDFAGYHTFGILPPAAAMDAPKATGFGSFTVSKTGTLTLSGKTADGESLTGGAFVGIAGDIALYQTLYTTKLKGSLQGSMDIDHPPGGTNAENTLDGMVSWSRPPSTALLLPSGFSPTDYSITGGGYLAPNAKAGLVVMDLPDEANNAALLFNPHSSEGPPFAADMTVRIRPGGTVERPSNNPAKTTLVVTPGTGAFSGGFTLSDANPLPVPATPRTITRTVKCQGMVFRQNGGWAGAGYFLMPALPGASWPVATKTPVVPGNVSLLPP